MGMAGLGFRELSSQLCQGESTESCLCVTVADSCCHCIWDSDGNALRESQSSSTEGGTEGLTPLQPERADTNIRQHFAAPVQTTWLQRAAVGNRNFLWHPNAVIQWPLLLLSPTQHQFHPRNRPALKFSPEFLCVSVERTDHCCSVI